MYEKTLRESCLNGRHDGIIYRNDYEADDDHDPTSYIVFKPNQVKSLEPIYSHDGHLLPLSMRFNQMSPKFID